MLINKGAMRIFVLWTCVAVLIDISKSKKIKTWGPYKIILREKAECVDKGTNDFYANVTSFNFVSREDFQVTGKFHAGLIFNDSFTITYNHAHWGNGGWKQNFINFEFPNGCSKMREIYPGPFEELVQIFNVTTSECSLGPGTVDFTITMGRSATIPALSAMPYGKLKGEMIVKLDGQIKGCIGAIADIVPKNDRS